MALDKHDYKNALLTQGACNLPALLNSMANVARRIGEEQGNYKHPILRLYAEQVLWLTARESGDFKSYSAAIDAVEAKLAEE